MDTDKAKIDFVVHEAQMARNERTIKSLIKVIIVCVIALAVSNALWLWAWMQYDYVDGEVDLSTVTVDAKDGIANYIGHSGDITNGKDQGNQSNGEDESKD